MKKNTHSTYAGLQSFLTASDIDSALIFADGGILVNNKEKTPILSIREILKILACEVNDFHLLTSTIILDCNILHAQTELTALGYQLLSVKSFLSTIPDDLQEIVLKGYHWVQWDMHSKFCGKCGGSLESKIETTEKKCLQCGYICFPRFSPAVIILVTKGDKMLLARSPHFPPEIYGLIAGFIDIGETAEMAVHRELKEEVGIEIQNLKYISSQTWPFPDSFMLAFTAEHKSGDIVLDKQEIEDAKWFDKSTLPKLPNKASIARKLIDNILNELTTKQC